MHSLISPDDHWMIWTSLIAIATVSIFLEQRYAFFRKMTGALVAMVLGMILSNIGFLPVKSASYDVVWEYIIPLTIPLLLMKTDVRKIFKETGRLFGAFHLSALGTVLGTIVAVYFLHAKVPSLNLIAPAMTGSYVGGSVNFIALVSIFKPPSDLVNATIVADNGIMAIYFILLITLPAMAISRKIFPVNEKTKSFLESDDPEGGENYWKPKPIGLLDIGIAMTVAFVIGAISFKVSEYFSGPSFPVAVQSILGQKYVMLTLLSILFPILFPKLSSNLNGSEELGVFFIFIFFALIGVPASIRLVVMEAPVMLLFCAIILTFNFLITFILGKWLHYELEELVMAAVVTSGGPMNGVAIASSKGWHALIVPALLAGIWGYIVGNFIGYITGLVLAYIF